MITESKAQCLPCNKKVEILKPTVFEGKDGKHPYVTGKCSLCMRTVHRWLRKTPATDGAKKRDRTNKTEPRKSRKRSNKKGITDTLR